MGVNGAMVVFALAIFRFGATKRHNPWDDLPPVTVGKESKERQLKKNSCAMPNGMSTGSIFPALLVEPVCVEARPFASDTCKVGRDCGSNFVVMNFANFFN